MGIANALSPERCDDGPSLKELDIETELRAISRKLERIEERERSISRSLELGWVVFAVWLLSRILW